MKNIVNRKISFVSSNASKPLYIKDVVSFFTPPTKENSLNSLHIKNNENILLNEHISVLSNVGADLYNDMVIPEVGNTKNVKFEKKYMELSKENVIEKHRNKKLKGNNISKENVVEKNRNKKLKGNNCKDNNSLKKKRKTVYMNGKVHSRGIDLSKHKLHNRNENLKQNRMTRTHQSWLPKKRNGKIKEKSTSSTFTDNDSSKEKKNRKSKGNTVSSKENDPLKKNKGRRPKEIIITAKDRDSLKWKSSGGKYVKLKPNITTLRDSFKNDQHIEAISMDDGGLYVGFHDPHVNVAQELRRTVASQKISKQSLLKLNTALIRNQKKFKDKQNIKVREQKKSLKKNKNKSKKNKNENPQEKQSMAGSIDASVQSMLFPNPYNIMYQSPYFTQPNNINVSMPLQQPTYIPQQNPNNLNVVYPSTPMSYPSTPMSLQQPVYLPQQNLNNLNQAYDMYSPLQQQAMALQQEAMALQQQAMAFSDPAMAFSDPAMALSPNMFISQPSSNQIFDPMLFPNLYYPQPCYNSPQPVIPQQTSVVQPDFTNESTGYSNQSVESSANDSEPPVGTNQLTGIRVPHLLENKEFFNTGIGVELLTQSLEKERNRRPKNNRSIQKLYQKLFVLFQEKTMIYLQQLSQKETIQKCRRNADKTITIRLNSLESHAAALQILDSITDSVPVGLEFNQNCHHKIEIQLQTDSEANLNLFRSLFLALRNKNLNYHSKLSVIKI